MINPGLVRSTRRISPERVADGLYVFPGAYEGDWDFFSETPGSKRVLRAQPVEESVPASTAYLDGIAGSDSFSGHEETSEVIEFDHPLRIPLDRQPGSVSGKRVHSPVTIVKEIDTASPLLYQAYAEGKKLAELRVDWYRINEQGVEEKYFSYTLKDVKVSEVKAILPNTKDPKEETLTHLEEVKLMYEKIEWRHEEGYEYSDSWKDEA